MAKFKSFFLFVSVFFLVGCALLQPQSPIGEIEVTRIVTQIVTQLVVVQETVIVPEITVPVISVVTPTPIPFDAAVIEAENQVFEFWDAFMQGDFETLVALSPPPFYLSDETLFTVESIREAYGDPGAPITNSIQVEVIFSGTISEGKSLGFITEEDTYLHSILVGDEDIAVIVFITVEDYPPEGTLYLFRRLEDRVEMAGFTG